MSDATNLRALQESEWFDTPPVPEAEGERLEHLATSGPSLLRWGARLVLAIGAWLRSDRASPAPEPLAPHPDPEAISPFPEPLGARQLRARPLRAGPPVGLTARKLQRQRTERAAGALRRATAEETHLDDEAWRAWHDAAHDTDARMEHLAAALERTSLLRRANPPPA